MRHAGHDHRNPRGLHDGPTDRAQKHAGKSATAVAAHDHKLSSLCVFEQPGCRSVADHDLVDRDIGIPLLPSA